MSEGDTAITTWFTCKLCTATQASTLQRNIFFTWLTIMQPPSLYEDNRYYGHQLIRLQVTVVPHASPQVLALSSHRLQQTLVRRRNTWLRNWTQRNRARFFRFLVWTKQLADVKYKLAAFNSCLFQQADAWRTPANCCWLLWSSRLSRHSGFFIRNGRLVSREANIVIHLPRTSTLLEWCSTNW